MRYGLKPLAGGHAGEDALEEYLLRRLSAEHVSALEAHLETCGFCAKSFDETAAFVHAIRTALAERDVYSPPPSPGGFTPGPSDDPPRENCC